MEHDALPSAPVEQHTGPVEQQFARSEQQAQRGTYRKPVLEQGDMALPRSRRKALE
jgi:hypothetical protein